MNRYRRFLPAVALSWLAVLSCSANRVLADVSELTFSHDVATIVYEKCAVCHHPDSSAPFSLITYEDVQQRAATIDAVLEAEYMPPWKPVDHGIDFANARSLTDEEERSLRNWIEAGCPEGDPAKTPAPPEFADGWTLGKPDLIVKMKGTFKVPADGPDIYRSFVFPLNLPADKWVKAVELQPHAKTAVHHAIFFLDATGNARKLDGADGQTGISGMGFLASFGEDIDVSSKSPAGNPWGTRSKQPSGLRKPKPKPPTEEDRAYRMNKSLARGLGGYVPGATPNLLPGDLAMALPQGSDVVMQTHFHPSGKAETEQARLALYFADRPPAQQLVPIMVPPMFGFGSGIVIPPGETDYRISDSFTLPTDVSAIGVSGHAHYICREMKLTAKLPNGDTLVLLHIDDWDLAWQDQYLFEEPLDLPAGTVLHAEIVYDNSAENPENPHYPPQEIRWGRGSEDEMGSLTLQTVAKNERERPQLQMAVRQHFMARLVDRKAPEMVQMLMQLDDNDDGKLQRSEAPPRLDDQLFQFIDADDDGAVDAAEFERVMELRDLFRDGGAAAELAQDLLRLLDHNDDKKLQQSEAPPQFTPIFRFVDSNGDQGLDFPELERAMKLRNQFGSGGQ